MKPTFRKVIEAMRACWYLRKCSKVGLLCRVVGKVIVENDGRIYLGNRVVIRGSHVPVELATYRGAVLSIGDGTFINGGVSICAQNSVEIGKNCAIGNYTLIMDTDFHSVGDIWARPQGAAVKIGDHVWLASRVTVLKGVTIGDGAVVAAGAVVTRDVPPATLVAGVPARVVRELHASEMAQG